MLHPTPKSTNLLRRFVMVCTICLGAAVLICVFFGLLVYSKPFFLLTDVEVTGPIALTVLGIAGSLFLLDRCLSVAEAILYRRAGNQGPIFIILAAAGLLAFSGCDQVSVSTNVKGVVQGTVNNPATGMKATYRNMEAKDIKLVMNDEVLGHTDIPLGEKFYIINEGIKGLVEKEGKVSIGCSLHITDEQGNVLMDEPDLFSGNDLFKKEEATFLRCAVSTGRPMETESYYNVRAKFWDKYGDGFIDNTVRIRSIDMP